MKLYLTRLTLPDRPSERRRLQSEGGYRLLSLALAELGEERSHLLLHRTAEGRPYLRYADGRAFDYDFSISHAGCFAVCALSEHPNSPVGVDLERIRRVSPALWGRYLAFIPDEAVGDAYSAILRWTRYEAAYKQKGRVTPADLAGECSVTLRPIPGYLLTVSGDEGTGELRWVAPSRLAEADRMEWIPPTETE